MSPFVSLLKGRGISLVGFAIQLKLVFFSHWDSPPTEIMTFSISIKCRRDCEGCKVTIVAILNAPTKDTNLVSRYLSLFVIVVLDIVGDVNCECWL